MTGSHRHTIQEEESQDCPRELEKQDVARLLYTCSHVTGRPPFAHVWATRPPAESVALLSEPYALCRPQL